MSTRDSAPFLSSSNRICGPVVRHLLRTLAMVFAGALGLIALGFVVFALFPPQIALWVGLPLLVLALGSAVYHWSRWSAFWAPISIPVHTTPWRGDDGAEWVTIVERAQMRPAIAEGAGSIQLEVLRASVYMKGREKHARRALIGDDAVFLGVWGERLWFFIESRFYARRNGLVGLHAHTLDVTWHRPRNGEELVERRKRRHPIVELETADGRVSIDLRNPPAEG